MSLPEECLQASRSSQRKNGVGSDEYSVSTIGLLTLLTRWATTLKGAEPQQQARMALGAICLAGLPASWPIFLTTGFKELNKENVMPEGVDKQNFMVPVMNGQLDVAELAKGFPFIKKGDLRILA